MHNRNLFDHVNGLTILRVKQNIIEQVFSIDIVL